MNEVDRKRNIRRTAFVITAIAIAFYIGFIMIGVVRA